MTLNARAIATLGIGYAPSVAARLGLWPIGEIALSSPDVFPAGRALPAKRSRLRHPARGDALIQIGFAIEASVRIGMPGSFSRSLHSVVSASAGLQVTSRVQTGVETRINAIADSQDVLLELLLVVD